MGAEKLAEKIVMKKKNIPKISPEVDEIVHDLQVHQVELQRQNKKLISAQEKLQLSNNELLFAQEELQRARDRYIDLFDNAPLAYFTVDLLTNRIVEVNLTASELLKVNRDYIGKHKLVRFIDPEFTDSFHICVRKTLDAPYKATCEIKMCRYDNTSFWALLNITGIPQSKRVRVAITDITERKQAEQVKDDFIGMVSHELRTPLTVVMGSIKVALSEGVTPEEIRELLQEADKGTEALSHILDNLIELSRYQSNRLKLSKSRINIGETIEDILKRETSHLNEHPVLFEKSEPLPDIEVDLTRLQQILHNLIDNAAKYSPENKEIRISVEKDKKNVIIGVSDRGKGMTEEEQVRLFEPFERLNQTSTTRPGLGLGLLVCKRLVEAHGGEITIESRVEHGTTFRFTLPLA